MMEIGEDKKTKSSISLVKEFDLNLPTSDEGDEEEDFFDFDEESRKHHRYHQQFEDDTVASNDCEGEGDGDGDGDRDPNGGMGGHNGYGIEEEDEGRHTRMLQETTGLPVEAFHGEMSEHDVVITEAYPVSAYHPNCDVLGGNSIQGLLDPLHGESGFSKRRKKIHYMETSMPIKSGFSKFRTTAYHMHDSMPIQAPRRKANWEKLERNKEAPTLNRDEDIDVAFSIGGPIASEFVLRMEFGKEIAPLVNDNRVVDAPEKDHERLLELDQQLQIQERQGKRPRNSGTGKKKIEIKWIEEKPRRMVAFVKRRDGLFKKTAELCTLCGADAAIITFTEAHNAYVFGNPTVDSVINRYIAGTLGVDDAVHEGDLERLREVDDKYVKAVARLEAEKKRGEIFDKVLAVVEGHAVPNEALWSEEVQQILATMEEMVQKPS